MENTLTMLLNGLEFTITFYLDDGSQATFRRNGEGSVRKWLTEIGTKGLFVDKEKGLFFTIGLGGF